MSAKLVLHATTSRIWYGGSTPVAVLTVVHRGERPAGGEWTAKNGVRVSFNGGTNSMYVPTGEGGSASDTLYAGYPGSITVVKVADMPRIKAAVAEFNARNEPAAPAPPPGVEVIQ